MPVGIALLRPLVCRFTHTQLLQTGANQTRVLGRRRRISWRAALGALSQGPLAVLIHGILSLATRLAHHTFCVCCGNRPSTRIPLRTKIHLAVVPQVERQHVHTSPACRQMSQLHNTSRRMPSTTTRLLHPDTRAMLTVRHLQVARLRTPMVTLRSPAKNSRPSTSACSASTCDTWLKHHSVHESAHAETRPH